jgi:ABC-type multidrug transport system fused ATPase/permease subunit
MFLELWMRIRPYRTQLISSFFCLICFTILGMLLPLVLKEIIDDIIPSGNKKLLVILLGGMFVIFMLRQIFNYVSHSLVHKLSQDVLCSFRKEVFAHVQSLTLTFHDNYRTGKLISNLINDIQRMQAMINQGIIALLVNSFSTIFILGYIFYLNWQLASLSVLVLPLYFYNFFKSQLALKHSQKRFSELTSEVSANLSEVLSGIRVIKSLARQDVENERFSKEFDTIAETALGIKKRSILCGICGDSISAVGLIITLFAGTYFVWNGSMSIGEFVSFYTYVGMAFGPLIALGNLAPIFSEGIAGLSRLMNLLDQKPEKTDGNRVPKKYSYGRVSFEHVSFAYSSSWVVDDFNLEIEPGQTVAFVGASGSGKSTLANLLLRFYEVGKGSIKVDGVDIRTLNEDYFRDQIGVVMQEPLLFSGSIAENIAYGKPDATSGDIEAAAKMANAHEFINQMDNGYKTEIGEKGLKLSGGQKQRIAIARTLLRKPKVLILDEATSALDNASEFEVQKALSSLHNKQTTLVIAHRLTTIKNADVIVVMDKGKILEKGRHEDLYKNRGAYFDLLNLNKTLALQ